ncbi:hypothetical protein D3C76_1519100 [compost metagenome]
MAPAPIRIMAVPVILFNPEVVKEMMFFVCFIAINPIMPARGKMIIESTLNDFSNSIFRIFPIGLMARSKIATTGATMARPKLGLTLVLSSSLVTTSPSAIFTPLLTSRLAIITVTIRPAMAGMNP